MRACPTVNTRARCSTSSLSADPGFEGGPSPRGFASPGSLEADVDRDRGASHPHAVSGGGLTGGARSTVRPGVWSTAYDAGAILDARVAARTGRGVVAGHATVEVAVCTRLTN